MKKFTMMILILGIGIGTTISFTSCKKKKGCTDKDAVNYDSEATKDDGSCIAKAAAAGDVQKVQKSLVLKYSGLGWSPCGSSVVLKNLVNTYTSKVVPVVVHLMDALTNANLNYSFIGLLACPSTPSYYAGDQKFSTETDGSSKITAINAADPVAQSNYTLTKGTGSVTVKTKTKFFQAGSGAYYLSVYVLDNNIPSSGSYIQAGAAAGFTHNYVICSANTPTSATGELLATNPALNSTFEKEYTITVTPHTTMANISVATIIWKKSGSTYTFVNAF